MDTAVVELDSLTDSVGPAAKNYDFLSIGWISLAFRQPEPRVFIRRIHVWRL